MIKIENLLKFETETFTGLILDAAINTAQQLWGMKCYDFRE